MLHPPLLFFHPDCFECYLHVFHGYIFRKQQGTSAYLIEVGGSSYVGMFGYLTAFEEMINQVKQVPVI